MSDTTVTTAAPAAQPAATPTPPAAAPAPAAQPDLAAQVAALQAQLDVLNKPGVVKTAGVFAWTKTKCGARLVADFYAFLKGMRTILFFGISGSLALANELEAIDLTPYVSKILPEGAHIDTAGAIVIMSLAGVGLRLITKTPAFAKWAGNKFGAGGASDSAVDEPQG